MRLDIASTIIRHTRITRQHLTPELKLRLITKDCELWTARSEEVPFVNDPFWGFYWPGGQALARYILDNGSVIEKKKVLDLGCGCGAASIAAVKMRAEKVVANDIDRCALIATKINAKLNKVELIIDENNFIGSKCIEFDTILVGDMFYDEQFANMLFDWLKTLAEDGKNILIGDPDRRVLTGHRRGLLTRGAIYRLTEDTRSENTGLGEAVVWGLAAGGTGGAGGTGAAGGTGSQSA